MARHQVVGPIVCGRCRAKNRPDWRRCQRCGAELAGSAAIPATADSASGSSIPLVTAIALTGLVVAMIAWPKAPVPEAVVTPLTLDAVTPPESAPATAPGVDTREPAREAVTAYAQGNLSAATAGFAEAVEANPDDAASLNNLGQMLVRQGKPTEALPPLLKAVSLSPRSWAYRFNLARARGLTGDWTGAVDDYRQADALFPDDYPTLYNLALALQKAGQPLDALPVLQRVTELQPAEPGYQLTLALACDAANQPEAAARAYTRFLELAPAATQAPAVRARLARLQPPPGASEPLAGDAPVRTLSTPTEPNPE
jgi:Flp pilus assembly protein TadD